MAAIISDVTSIFTSAIGWVGTVIDTVTTEPLLLMFCIVPLVGLGVGLTKRLLRL